MKEQCDLCGHVTDRNTDIDFQETVRGVGTSAISKEVCEDCSCKIWDILNKPPTSKPTIYDKLCEGGVEAFAKEIAERGRCGMCAYAWHSEECADPDFDEDNPQETCVRGLLKRLNQEWKG
jgi:hypothetical protein